MKLPAIEMFLDMFRGANRRTSIVLLTSAATLCAWHAVGNYTAWSNNMPPSLHIFDDSELSAAVWALLSSVLLVGIVPLLVVKLLFRESLADYGVRWGDLRFTIISSLLFTPLLAFIGYSAAQTIAFQAHYPVNPLARSSPEALAWNISAQIFWYAAWEFHFRGFVQHGLGKSFGVPAGIWVQTLASTLAHFGSPIVEVFGCILGGLLWGLLTFRTHSLLGSIYQHWALGTAVDFFICRRGW